MEIKILHSENNEGYERQTMVVNGKERQYVGPLCDCPEDAIIGRDLVSCEDITGFMKEAYEAGQKGEEFTLTHADEEPK